MTTNQKTWLIPAVAAALLGGTIVLPSASAQTVPGINGTKGPTGADNTGGSDSKGTTGMSRMSTSRHHKMGKEHHSRPSHHSMRGTGSSSAAGTSGMHTGQAVGARNHSTDGTAGGRVGTGPTDTGTGASGSGQRMTLYEVAARP